MIQRIQSVYLVLGMLILASLLFFDMLWGGPVTEVYSWFAPALIVLAALTIGIAGFSVFAYKNRPKQKTLVFVAQVLVLLLSIVLFGGLYLAGALTVRDASGVLDWGMILVLLIPPVAYIFFMLARRNIEGDIKLVKSMDRLRG